jgi:hypothetical protein
MQPTKLQMQEPLDEDSPPDPHKPKKKSQELAGLETSLGEAWKLLAEGSRRNSACELAKSAQMVLEDEEFEDMIPIYAAAAISDDHEDGIDDPKSYKAAPTIRPPRNGIRRCKKHLRELNRIKSLEIS